MTTELDPGADPSLDPEPDAEPHVGVPLEPDDESLGDDEGQGRIRQLVAQELGEEWAQRFSTVWQRLDDWDLRHNVSEGLRERKKRLTRQRISDVATAMFVARGYDNVRVSEIAENVGVSEKTIYNYFPTKESLVFDDAEQQLMRLAAAVRERQPGSSPTAAVVGSLKDDMARFGAAIGEGGLDFLPAFGRMMRETPTLRAAWGEHRHAMVQTLTAILAQEAGVDPRDPEPISAARALVSLLELMFDSQMRHAGEITRADEMAAAVAADLDRAQRLLDTGLWSFHLMVEGHKTKDQLRDAAVAAEQARQQVIAALRDAKAAFRQIREEAQAVRREQRELQRAAVRDKHQQAREAARLRGRGRS